jgi:hypothetical protein
MAQGFMGSGELAFRPWDSSIGVAPSRFNYLLTKARLLSIIFRSPSLGERSFYSNGFIRPSYLPIQRGTLGASLYGLTLQACKLLIDV